MPIRPFLAPDHSFNPEEIAKMSAAFEAVYLHHSLIISRIAFPKKTGVHMTTKLSLGKAASLTRRGKMILASRDLWSVPKIKQRRLRGKRVWIHLALGEFR